MHGRLLDNIDGNSYSNSSSWCICGLVVQHNGNKVFLFIYLVLKISLIDSPHLSSYCDVPSRRLPQHEL